MVHVLDTIPEAYSIPVRLDKIRPCTECKDHDRSHGAYADAGLAIITVADAHYFRSPIEVVAACPLTDCCHHHHHHYCYLIRYFDSCPANSLPIVPFSVYLHSAVVGLFGRSTNKTNNNHTSLCQPHTINKTLQCETMDEWMQLLRP